MAAEENRTLIKLVFEEAPAGQLAIRIDDWEGFNLSGLQPALTIDGQARQPVSCGVEAEDAAPVKAVFDFGDGLSLCLSFERLTGTLIRVNPSLSNGADAGRVLQEAVLLATGSGAALGADPSAVRVLEQGNYWGRVVPLVEGGETPAEAGGEPNTHAGTASHASELVSVVYDREARRALLAGFVSSERWLGRIQCNTAEDGSLAWHMAFDGGDLAIAPGETIKLEQIVFLAGPEPWALLERYGDEVCQLHGARILSKPPVSWCSWYPYRLGITEDRMLEEARIAAARLKPLGLSIMEIDLGWQRQHLPCAYEENDQFPHGLGWLSERLADLGLDLGLWHAPHTISAFDPLAQEHPEWLIQGDDGKPLAYWTWFWAPHGDVYILDLTNPGSQEWLRGKAATLRERGVKYLKSDFIGCVADSRAKRRHDPRIVSGCGTEAGRISARILSEELPDALLLNCGGPEMPGTGHWPLLYTCSDTGNTGFISQAFQRENYLALACHLFKNRRWGIIQPSCLCVGLPGTLEEARMRATAAFLAGGQIDISDTLTTLPEDRWHALTATLPPLGVSAEPIDLFEPVLRQTDFEYVASCKEEGGEAKPPEEAPPGSVWHLRVEAGWDAWNLVGIFAFEQRTTSDGPQMERFLIPLERLGLGAATPLNAYEFWSNQALGGLPGGRTNPNDYTHPGDFQDLLVGHATDSIDVAFYGPGAKLLCLRAARPHPWVLGTSFHQSCGVELKEVAWDAETRTLSGLLDRPAGESGVIVFSCGGLEVEAAEVQGSEAVTRPGANGSVALPIAVTQQPAPWKLRFRPVA